MPASAMGSYFTEDPKPVGTKKPKRSVDMLAGRPGYGGSDGDGTR